MYNCEDCNQKYNKWTGRCQCGSWNIVDFSENHPTQEFLVSDPVKFSTNIEEFDRVCCPQNPALIVLAGEPGIGKSTLVSQICSESKKIVLYISGEEPIGNIKNRIKKTTNSVFIYNLIYAEDIEALIKKHNPQILILDSLHTTKSRTSDGAVNQIKSVTMQMVLLTRKYNLFSILVSHITKDGTLSGPKTIEHMVDVVLYLEGERYEQLRLLKSIKNRLGPTNEIGVFQMTETGLIQITNPSDILLPNRPNNMPGSTILATVEGNRSFLLETQALVAPSFHQQIEVIGYDIRRIRMIIAVLQTHCKLDLRGFDIYINVVGGIKVTDTAADLSIAAGIISGFFKRTIHQKVCFFGEIGLTAEIRAVQFHGQRIKEAKRLGYKVYSNDPSAIQISSLQDLIKMLQKNTNSNKPRQESN